MDRSRQASRHTRNPVDGVRTDVRRTVLTCRHCPIPQQGSLASGDSTGYGAAYSTEVSTVAQKLTAAQQRALKRETVAWEDLSDEDFARLFDEGQPVRVRVRRPPPKTLTIALDERTLNRLKRVARHKQVRARHLVAMWIAERLSQERSAEK